MTVRYKQPAQRYRCEIDVKRSRFIATVTATDSIEQAREFIHEIQTEFPDANHNCWACLIGAPGNPSHCAMNDDGEPHGSAGKPMLTALQHGDIGDITVVVSRYFGGIRLGKGGMARAYTDAVMTALSGLSSKEKIDYRSLLITCDYPFLDSLKRLFNDYEALLEAEQFADLVTLHLRLPQENVEPFHAHVTEMSHGRITITTS